MNITRGLRRRLADVNVEFAKAQAIQELDRVAAQKVPIREFEKQVTFHRTEVALAEVRSQSADDRVREAQRDCDEAAAKAEAMPLS